MAKRRKEAMDEGLDSLCQGVKRLRTTTTPDQDPAVVKEGAQPAGPGIRLLGPATSKTSSGKASRLPSRAEHPVLQEVPSTGSATVESVPAPTPSAQPPMDKQTRAMLSPLDIPFPRPRRHLVRGAGAGLSVHAPPLRPVPEEGSEPHACASNSEDRIAEPSTPGHEDLASPTYETILVKRKYARREKGEVDFSSIYDEANLLLRSLHFERLSAPVDGQNSLAAPLKRRK